MGSGKFDPGAYRAFSSSTKGKATDDIFSSRSIHKDLNPKGVKLRESRDSADSPEATPIIVAIDVTGSMGMLADVIAREGLGTLFTSILDTKPISNPHVMFMAIGDAHCDQAPLQVSQFEADNRIVEQLTQIWIEHGGGGNDAESYNFPWYFAAHHTEHDSIAKRAKRGYLFTVGDEEAPDDLTRDQIQKFLGYKPEREMSSEEMLTEAERKYEVFHIIIKEGDYARNHLTGVTKSWRDLLGQHAIQLDDHKKLAETIVSIIEVREGRDAKDVTKKWGRVVYDAVKELPAGRSPNLKLTK